MDKTINMDSKKDISIYKTKDKLSKTSGISAVDGSVSNHDNYKEDKDIDINTSLKDFGLFVNKKTKKLATALYLVTNFLSDNEPLKWKLRERSVFLLSGVSNVRYESVSEVDNVFACYSVLIDEVISLLDIAVESKLISEMNYLILRKEYFALRGLIVSEEYAKEKSGKFIFPNEFFEDEVGVGTQLNNSQPQKGIQKETQMIDKIEKNTYIKNQQTSSLYIGSEEKNTATINKGHSLGIGHNIHKGQKQVKDTKDKVLSVRKAVKPASVKLNRRGVILKLFKNKKGKEFTIKDISYEVSDCSEKTIQRELISLVADGVLEKQGERRWSRYSLK